MPAHIVAIVLGIWLTTAPGVLGYGDPARTNDHIIGPLIISFAMIATSEVTRPVRWINVVLGFWLVVAPVALGYSGRVSLHSAAIGLMVAALSCVRGRLHERIGGGWRVLWQR